MSQTLRFPAGLYGVTPDWHDANRLQAAIVQAAAGGMTAVQLRLKDLDRDQRRAIATQLLPVCRQANVPLIINDDWQLAIEIGASGVHLGKDDADPALVRRELTPSMCLGVSCYSDLQRARQMLELGVDYIAFGAMFSSGTKPQAPPAALSILTEGKALALKHAPDTAVVAIGGITADNAASVLAAGADSVAVVGGLFLAKDIEDAAWRLSALCPGTAGN